MAGKLRLDPAAAALLRLGEARGPNGLGVVLDLGCGWGQMGMLLLVARHAAALIGMDRASAKIAAAATAGEGLPARFETADLATAALPGCDTVLLIDILYQMPEPAQRALLVRTVQAARRRIVIRAFDPARGWRSRLALAMERAGRRLRGEAARAAIAPLDLGSLAAPLTEAGFTVTITPCWGRTPLANVLLIAERP